MTKWEYKVVEVIDAGGGYGTIFADEIETKCNSLGDEGWELVNGYYYNNMVAINARLIFKRPKQ